MGTTTMQTSNAKYILSVFGKKSNGSPTLWRYPASTAAPGGRLLRSGLRSSCCSQGWSRRDVLAKESTSFRVPVQACLTPGSTRGAQCLQQLVPQRRQLHSACTQASPICISLCFTRFWRDGLSWWEIHERCKRRRHWWSYGHASAHVSTVIKIIFCVHVHADGAASSPVDMVAAEPTFRHEYVFSDTELSLFVL